MESSARPPAAAEAEVTHGTVKHDGKENSNDLTERDPPKDANAILDPRIVNLKKQQEKLQSLHERA